MARLSKIKTDKKNIRTLVMKLGNKNLIVLRGQKGYVMCGYLSLKAAGKFKDAAAVITGVSTLKEALKAKVYSATLKAKRLGIHKGQCIKDVLKIIA